MYNWKQNRNCEPVVLHWNDDENTGWSISPIIGGDGFRVFYHGLPQGDFPNMRAAQLQVIRTIADHQRNRGDVLEQTVVDLNSAIQKHCETLKKAGWM